jgi:hypothetical protein
VGSHVGYPQLPVRHRGPEELLDVARGMLGVISTRLIRNHAAALPDRPQQ